MTSRSSQMLIADLRELVEALDRRVPCVERAGERDIARDAARLRVQALNRIAAIERAAGTATDDGAEPPDDPSGG